MTEETGSYLYSAKKSHPKRSILLPYGAKLTKMPQWGNFIARADMDLQAFACLNRDGMLICQGTARAMELRFSRERWLHGMHP